MRSAAAWLRMAAIGALKTPQPGRAGPKHRMVFLVAERAVAFADFARLVARTFDSAKSARFGKIPQTRPHFSPYFVVFFAFLGDDSPRDG
ncbi:hypothetical protein [Shimia biformata]|uniref:hypothetical protein n=1 Tax=Shimia biformata TaxID=1294299 RepID=UPI0019521FB6|nr:hypothetical protein [Shimia biformata]